MSYDLCQKKNRAFRIISAFAFAAVLALCAGGCEYDPDYDGNGEFRMEGEEKPNANSYYYYFLNQSDYPVSVMINHNTIDLRANSYISYIYLGTRKYENVRYSPTDAVRVVLGGSTAYFRNR